MPRQIERRQGKESAEKSWEQRTAEEAGIDLSEDDGSGSEDRGNNRKSRGGGAGALQAVGQSLLSQKV